MPWLDLQGLPGEGSFLSTAAFPPAIPEAIMAEVLIKDAGRGSECP